MEKLNESENRILLIEKIVIKRRVKEFKKMFRHFLLTSRFNNETWNENIEYRKKHPNIGCIYCSPDPISKDIPPDRKSVV